MTISSTPAMIRYLPRALIVGLLAPFPTDWFDLRGSTGAMRLFSGLEMILLYTLIPGLLIGTAGWVRSKRVDRMFLVVFLGALIIALSLVVANVGTLFRLRLQYVLPAIPLALAGHPHRFWRRVFRRLRGAQHQPSKWSDPDSTSTALHQPAPKAAGHRPFDGSRDLLNPHRE